MLIYCEAGQWFGKKGNVVGRPKVMGIDSFDSFRSLGLANKAVLIETDCNGHIENITAVDGCCVDSITVPPTHGLYTNITLVTEEPVCS